MNFIIRLGSIAALVFCALHASAAGSPTPGLCMPAETAYFVCRTSKERWISLCGTAQRALQYRFGTLARTELRFPEDPAAGAASFAFAHYFRFQTDRTEIGFRNQGVDYALFDYTEEGKRRAGIRVTTTEGKETELVCSGRITSRLGQLDGIVRCDPDNALNSGACR